MLLCTENWATLVLNQLNRWVRCRGAERRRTLYKKRWCRWAVRPFTIKLPSWRCSFGSLDVISRTKIRRTARESHENGLWTCPLQQMRLEHFELFFCLTFSISYWSKRIKICAWLANGMLPGRVKKACILTNFEKLSHRSQSFAQRNFCSNPENIFS